MQIKVQSRLWNQAMSLPKAHDEHAHQNKSDCANEGDIACGCHGNPVFDGTGPVYRRLLMIVIAINAVMFAVETYAGHVSNSKALQADALDFLGDTFTYGLSLAVIGQSLRVRSIAALFKGMSLTLMGLWVIGSTAWEVLVLGLPRADVMGSIGFLAFAANLASVLLLVRYKDGDANIRSVWLCSRNDMVGNLIVVGAAATVWQTQSAWPDLVVAIIMGTLFLSSSFQILRQAWAEYRSGEDHGALTGHGHKH
jgi:Co/Zn/Cd efflux system component